MIKFSPSQGGFPAPGKEAGSPAVSQPNHKEDFSSVGYLEALRLETENEGK